MNKIAGLGTAACLLGAMVSAGCSADMPSAAAAVTSTADSYVVLGVAPSNMMLQIDEAVVQDNKVVKLVNLLPLHLYGQTAGPYIVVKAKPDATLVIHSASIMAGHSIFGVLYHPVKDTLSFQAPAGKVVYVSDVAFSFEGRNFRSEYKQNFQGAKDFLEIHYPALADKLEQGSSAVVPCPNCRL